MRILGYNVEDIIATAMEVYDEKTLIMLASGDIDRIALRMRR